MFSLKTEKDIWKMRKAGLLTWSAHELVRKIIRPGMTTRELDAEVEKLFDRNFAVGMFKGVPGRVPFPAVTCISINDQVVHGIPGDRVIQDGDLVSVDLGCKIDGWCGDSAYTSLVGSVSEKAKKLVQTTRETLWLAIERLKTARYWSEVARDMEKYVRERGFSVVESFVGHGIGRTMHEEPQVPNFIYESFLREEDFQIRPGLVIAIEPMVNEGGKRIKQLSDFWTITTADGKLSAHEEHTVGMLKTGPLVLTGPPETEDERKMVDQFFERYEKNK
ncbi:MAG: type I methionyl aminopeptidase [Thermoguttaceae bacterium]|nr:type I methionyl aminopeptidase [Thermoguttaceae bacterium]MBR4751900.1 type I methionyl aminopeptidase [Thermoguttaceae bacterium]